MKIIISHDVDHISIHEHWFNDLFIWKFLIKTLLYVLTRQISLSVGLKRVTALFGARFHNLPELMEFDNANNVPSTFFVGMSNGLGMSYSLKSAQKVIGLIQAQGFQIGVHGIAYDNLALIQKEYNRFSSIVGVACNFGVRNHYLRFVEETPLLQQTAGYLFDSSDYGLKNPYTVNGLLEFPVCLMDSYLLSDAKNDLESVKQKTIKTLQDAERLALSYFTVIFHDVYYSAAFPDHKAWYEWFIKYVSEKYQLTDFASATKQIMS